MRNGHERHGTLLTAALAGSGLLFGTTTFAQDAWEWEPDEGYHQEEWYDPSDWFDDDSRVDYEYDYDDSYPYTYDDDWYVYDDVYDDWDDFTYDGVYDDWDGNAYDGVKYGVHYTWNSRLNEWETDYGWYADKYEWYDGIHYGTHYVWNPATHEWKSDYGWYADKYDYYTDDYDGSDEQRRQQEKEQQSKSGDAAKGKGEEQRKEYLFHGRIADTKRVSIEGASKDHALVKLEAKDGRTATVDLGPDMRLSDLGISAGDLVTVRGRKGTIDDRSVVLASQISVQDTYHMARADRRGGDRPGGMERSGSRGSPESPPAKSLRGTVEDYRKTSIDGREGHTYMKVRLENGRKAIVDIGPRLSMSDLGLARGDRLVVRGVKRTVDGNPVVVARRVSVDGRSMTVSRPGSGRKSAEPSSGTAVVRRNVEDYQRIELEGRPEAHTVVKLRLQNGESCIVDLGPNVSRKDIDLDRLEDSRVEMRGKWRDVGDRKVFVARSICINGGERMQLSSAAR